MVASGYKQTNKQRKREIRIKTKTHLIMVHVSRLVSWPIRGKSVNDRSTEMRVNFKTIGGAQENVIKVIHRQRQLCKDFIIVNSIIAKLKTNSCKPTLK